MRMSKFKKEIMIRQIEKRHARNIDKNVYYNNKFLGWLLPYEGEFETEDELIAILDKINRRVNTQVCQATGVPPVLLFQKEKEYLQPLPNQKVIESYLNNNRQITVQKDSMITYKASKYSVPSAYIGKSVRCRETEEKLYVYYNTELVTVHNLSKQKLNYHKKHYTELLSHLIEDEDTVVSMAEANLRQMDAFL